VEARVFGDAVAPCGCVFRLVQAIDHPASDERFDATDERVGSLSKKRMLLV